MQYTPDLISENIIDREYTVNNLNEYLKEWNVLIN